MKAKPITLSFLAFFSSALLSSAAALTWDGGGADGKWSTATNWSTDVAPAATGDTLTFAGTTNLSVTNDAVTSLATSGTAITFASGAGSFAISGNTLTLGSGGGGGQTIIQQSSANAQTISANINLSGGNGDRNIVFASGAGSLTLSGNISFSNDWLFPNTTAGTIILSGSNTGDGKATAAITAGTNTMRAMMRNNVAGTVLTIGSDGALGNSGSGSAAAGTASLRGIVANQNMTINTVGNRNLSGSTFAINAANLTFNGSSNLTIGNVVNQAGNRDFVVSSTGTVTVATGVFLSGDQTGRRIYNNLSGTGGMIVNGQIFDTLHSSGISTNTTTADAGAVSTKSVYRKAGTGSLTLNGDSSTSFNGVMQVEAGTVKLGHSGALGASDGSASTATQMMGGTLDVNGQTTNEYVRVLSNSVFENTSASAASITSSVDVVANLTVQGSGGLTVPRLIGLFATRTVTKLDSGTLTTNGSSHNNLISWDIQAGKVVLANSAGYGADRGVLLRGGTLQLSGSNSDLINNDQAFTINSGTFDLNGKSETVAGLTGSGGAITNTHATAAVLTMGGGAGSVASGSYAGVVQDGVGSVGLTKIGTGTQTLSGTSTYTGATTVSAGTLLVTGALGATHVTVANDAIIGGSGSIGGGLTLADGAILDVTGGNLTTGSSLLTLTGSITLADFSFADILGWDAASASDGTYTLINGGSSLSLLGTTPIVSNPFSFGSGKYGYFRQGSLQAVIYTVPETSSVIFVLLGAVAMMRRNRLNC